MRIKDTICAIATGMGNAGIGIIRLSGDEAFSIAEKVFRGKKNIEAMKSYEAAYGNIISVEDGEIIDEVIVLKMKAPHTYTTEDTVEINCHGGMVVLRRVMYELLKQGARTAEPGEFTKRAYLGGRIDMSQAEAVIDVINAKSELALKSSERELRGELKEKINSMREKLLYHTAYIESALDDPENYSLEGYSERLLTDVQDILNEVERLIKSSDSGRLIKEGIKTAIVGRPNAGKSSVLNMLLGEERAIVTDIAGTTRDTLEESVNIDGMILNLIDTAGIRNTEDKVEKIGVKKAVENINDADLVLYIIDGSEELCEEDKDIIDKISGKKVVTLINKNDLEIKLDMERLLKLLEEASIVTENGSASDTDTKYKNILYISAAKSDGKKELSELLKEMFFNSEIGYNDELYITNQRHKEAFMDARESLLLVRKSIEDGMEEDFFTIDLLSAYESLGLIIGEALRDDLADKIFSEFCMGK